MKTIYFVRHGESETNTGTAGLGIDSALTEKGKSQAEEVAKRCQNFPVDVILVSNKKRAQETAEVISGQIGVGFETFPFLAEIRRPSAQIGKTADDPEYLKIKKELDDNFTVPGWRHSDEENFDDLKERSLKIIKFLEERSEENILVIAHGQILRMIIACIIMGEELTPKEGERFKLALHTKNTGITVLNYNNDKEEPHWALITWNDHAHLG